MPKNQKNPKKIQKKLKIFFFKNTKKKYTKNLKKKYKKIQKFIKELKKIQKKSKMVKNLKILRNHKGQNTNKQRKSSFQILDVRSYMQDLRCQMLSDK